MNLNFSVHYLFYENFREIDFTKKMLYIPILSIGTTLMFFPFT